MTELPEKNLDLRALGRRIAAFPGVKEKMRQAIFRERRAAEPAGGLEAALEGFESPAEPEVSDDLKRTLDHATNALDLIQNDQAAPLSPEQSGALEAVILLVGRPALLVRNDDFDAPGEPWTILSDPAVHAAICRRLPSVGRVQAVVNNATQMVGTAFLVAPDVVMTNRHVVKAMARPDRIPNPTRWDWVAGIRPQIDFKEEFNVTGTRIHVLGDILYVSEDKNEDLALIRVEAQSADPPGLPLTEPMTLAAVGPAPGAHPEVYLVGYPASDNERITPDPVMKDIFGDVFEKKRLQPGEVGTLYDPQQVFGHDCSTLGGNSGSCVLDLTSNRVFGLHYSGSYMRANYAVSLWTKTAEQALTAAGVQFG